MKVSTGKIRLLFCFTHLLVASHGHMPWEISRWTTTTYQAFFLSEIFRDSTLTLEATGSSCFTNVATYQYTTGQVLWKGSCFSSPFNFNAPPILKVLYFSSPLLNMRKNSMYLCPNGDYWQPATFPRTDHNTLFSQAATCLRSDTVTSVSYSVP